MMFSITPSIPASCRVGRWHGLIGPEAKDRSPSTPHRTGLANF
ncbi:MAG: hypothetical protein NT164_00815 [Verrucomicrobiae bacterium]|nr:hypothetical protein [Verrucomicrobiae bacterium]